MEIIRDYRVLIRAALDGFWQVDNQGRFVDVNDVYCDLIGYTRDELLNMCIADVEVDETPEDIARHVQDIKAAGTHRFETRHRTRDGRIINIEVSAHYDPAQDSIFTFLRDITSRLAAERTLRQRTHDLTERVKELNCLLELSSLIAQPDLTLTEVLQQAVELLPPAWQYPELAAAQVQLPDACFATPGFRVTPWRLTCNLEANEPARGQISVVYLDNLSDGGDDPFLPQESQLLAAVAQRLNGLIQRRRAEEALHLREMSLNSLLELSQRASTLHERDIIQLALEEVERLTLSEIGYLHFVNADQNTIQLFTWSRRTLGQCTATHDEHYPLELAGVWADCARLKRPVMHNDYQNCLNKKGYPIGHPHLIRHLSAPVVEDGIVRLIIGVGNKATDYNDADARQLLLTAEHVWRIVRRRRAEEEARREAERVAMLARVAARLNTQLELPVVLQTVCEETAQVLGVPAASVCSFDHTAHTLCHTAIAGQTFASPDALQPELVALLDAGPWNDDLFILPEPMPRYQLGALIAAHLTHDGQDLGVLAGYTFDTSRRWEANEVALLSGLANLAAQAITNAHLFTEVRRSQEQLQTLSRRLVEVQEIERRHIARELHDEVGQVLTAVKINLQTLRRQLAATTYALRLDENIDSTQRALEQVRNISLDLRPSVLDDLGLSAALEWYVQRLSHLGGLKPQLTLPDHSPRWSPTVEITCFRVAQEALTNILRHARAWHVWIELRYTPTELRLQIRDDGQGFDPASTRLHAAQTGSSVGLLSMAERVALAGGQLKIESGPGQGTRIQVIFNTAVLR